MISNEIYIVRVGVIAVIGPERIFGSRCKNVLYLNNVKQLPLKKLLWSNEIFDFVRSMFTNGMIS